jgi:hypothetical protein
LYEYVYHIHETASELQVILDVLGNVFVRKKSLTDPAMAEFTEGSEDRRTRPYEGLQPKINYVVTQIWRR